MSTRTTTSSRMSKKRSPMRMKRIAYTVASGVLCALATSWSSAQALVYGTETNRVTFSGER